MWEWIGLRRGSAGVPFDQSDTQSVPRVTVYWRPGCGFCSALLTGLQRLEVPFTAIDIWQDPDAAAFVRSVARGYETVPTVSVGDQHLVNPTAREVLALSSGHTIS